MHALAYACFFLADFLFSVASCLLFHRRGYDQGKADARQEQVSWVGQGPIPSGQRAEPKSVNPDPFWWERTELDVQKEREKIWMEE